MTEWKDILKKIEKDGGKLHELLKDTSAEIQEDAIIIYMKDEETQKKARGQHQKLIKKLPELWKNKNIQFTVGTPPNDNEIINQATARPNTVRLTSPLQALNHTRIGEHTQPALKAAADADQTCSSVYKQLTEKTKQLADETLEVNFIWRVRVGGMRGFQELLLPVFHPVYGVPFIPASSLKGAVRAWAKQNGKSATEINRLFGTLDNGVGCVQFFDAFPTKPSLSVDMANPQWPWEGNRVKYDPKPHALLSMEQPKVLIGISKTSRLKNNDDLQTVKEWLEQALGSGIGSRVSGGYGRTQLSAGLAYSSSHPFQIWTQGMYGATPPARENNYQGEVEFRPTALRGVLSYWFRAFALGLYDSQTCQQLENRLLGNLSQEGTIRIGVECQKQETSSDKIYSYAGTILLEAKYQNHLRLIEKILCFASHVSGVGRGSRRPLHINSSRGRGCHWELSENIFPYDKQAWKNLITGIQETFREVQKNGQTPTQQTPGDARNRYQDTINKDARIYLVPSSRMIHPRQVRNWSQQGHTPAIRGQALETLYGDNRFKGETRNQGGNAFVGGKLGTPSFVIIQSNFPQQNPYQVVSVFGAGHPQRNEFIQALPNDSIQVYP
jgi:CRISPR-associated protein Cmr6